MPKPSLILAIACLSCFVPPAAAQPIDLAFAIPAQVGGTMETGAGWVFWFFEPGSQANITLSAQAGGTFEVISYPLADVRVNGTETQVKHPAAHLGNSSTAVDPVSWTLHAGRRDGGSFLFARGGGPTALEVTMGYPTAGLTHSHGDVGGLVPARSTEEFPFWWTKDVGSADVALAASEALDAKPFTVSRSDVVELMWSGMVVDCEPGQHCPEGGGRQSFRNDLPLDSGLGVGQIDYVQWRGTGHILGSGALDMALVGGPTLDIAIEGWSRLPKASLGQPCKACRLDGESTLSVTGAFELAGMRSVDGETLRAQLDGQGVAVRIDEEKVDPATIGLAGLAATTAATAVALVILKVLLAPFFTRLTKEQALEHPRRKQIFEYIQRHPGANFREVARNTSIAAGTVRHHLNVLERSGQVVEHTHGSTVRLFENHGKFEHNWSDLVLLREPSLGKLHDWLKDHPNSPQKAVLEAMEAEKWSRSTTQHRLSRLVDGGVASIRLQGRLKLYSVIDRKAAKSGPLGLSTSGPPASI